DGIDLLLGLGIAELQPFAVRTAALRQPHTVRRLPGPARQECRDVLLVGFQPMVRLQQDGAVGPRFELDVAAQELDRLEGGLRRTVQRRFSRYRWCWPDLAAGGAPLQWRVFDDAVRSANPRLRPEWPFTSRRFSARVRSSTKGEKAWISNTPTAPRRCWRNSTS